MAKMASLHADGVTDLLSYQIGIEQERERIAQLFDSSHIAADGDSMHNQSGNCPACWGLALIKGEQK
jgi:hypothetical protein